MDTIYESYSHRKVFIRYHFIFSTKYRRKCFSGIEEKVCKAFKWVEHRCAFKIIEIGVDKDHVHLLVKSNTQLSIGQIIRRLKQLSNRKLWEMDEKWFSQFYWKKKKIWTNGYFCSTIGQISESNVREYIKNQG